jgi:hypothetical protein
LGPPSGNGPESSATSKGPSTAHRTNLGD